MDYYQPITNVSEIPINDGRTSFTADELLDRSELRNYHEQMVALVPHVDVAFREMFHVSDLDTWKDSFSNVLNSLYRTPLPSVPLPEAYDNFPISTQNAMIDEGVHIGITGRWMENCMIDCDLKKNVRMCGYISW